MTNSESFNNEVKQLLSGYIPDKDTAGYVAIKITRLYEKYLSERLFSHNDSNGKE